MSFISIFILVLVAAIILALLYALFHMLIVFIPVIIIVAVGIWLINRFGKSENDKIERKESFKNFSYFKNAQSSDANKRKPARNVTTKDVDDDNKRN